jgi:Cysteine-rich CPXCG
VKARAKRKKRRREPSGAAAVACPFCGEAEELFVDAGGGDAQVYTEDCAVCCRPRVVHVEPGDEPGEVRVWLERGE